MKRFPVVILCAILFASPAAKAGNYKNFTVAIYSPIGATIAMKDPQWLADHWARLTSQVKIDKIYIETYRSRQFADEATLEPIKKFFQDKGVQVAGGMALDAGSINGQFQSPCYTDPKDRQMIKDATELTARHFDEIILDDFFFNTTKYDSDIAAKEDKTWTQFRLELMDSVARDLVIGPAKAINPKIKMVIKFPNWYEHFQGLGYDLDQEPKLFDGIYTGTETRDPLLTEQHLQAYESYSIMRYFENIITSIATPSSCGTPLLARPARSRSSICSRWNARSMSAKDRPGNFNIPVSIMSRCANPSAKPTPISPAPPVTPSNKPTPSSASSAMRSASKAIAPITPPAKIFSTIILA
jgi:hypothetical protein